MYMFIKKTATALIALLIFGAFFSLSAQQRAFALVVNKTGMGFIIRAGQKKPALINDLLQEADEVETSAGATVTIQLSSGVVCQIGPATKLRINQLSRNGQAVNANMNLTRGSVTSQANMPAGSRIQVVTPTAIAGVRGTEFIVEANAQSTNVLVNTGEVNVQDPSGTNSVSVPAGNKATADAQGLHSAILEKFEKQKFEILKKFEEMRQRNFDAVVEQKRRDQELIEQRRNNPFNRPQPTPQPDPNTPDPNNPPPVPENP